MKLNFNHSQSTPMNQIYVTAGGIGKRRIYIGIEVHKTYYFQYKASIFGYKLQE